MISRFRFLRVNDEDEFVQDMEPYFASWMWADPRNNDSNWIPTQMTASSIRSFLSNFPESMIVPIISITGNNITMTIENEHDEWPFEILGGTELSIVYFTWNP